VESGDHHRRQMLPSKRRCCGSLPHRHVAASINGISDAAVPVTISTHQTGFGLHPSKGLLTGAQYRRSRLPFATRGTPNAYWGT
jgi:hypothetical protein